MTNEEQMRVIRNWTLGMRVYNVDTRWFGKISFTIGVVQHIGPCCTEDQAINTSYELVRDHVWNIVA